MHQIKEINEEYLSELRKRFYESPILSNILELARLYGAEYEIQCEIYQIIL